MVHVFRRWLAAATIALVIGLAGSPAGADPADTANQPVQRECFEEGGNQRFCVDLVFGCGATDSACLIDDFSGGILRAHGDTSMKYAAYLARGIVLRREKQMSDAIGDFEAAQTLQPHLATPFILIGRAYGALGHDVRALMSFNEADRRAPGLPTVLADRAAARQRIGDAAGAIADLTQAIGVMRSGRAIPDGAEEAIETLLVARGTAWLAKRDITNARTDFEAALKLMPENASAREALERLR